MQILHNKSRKPEDTGLSPNQVERLQEDYSRVNDFEKSQSAKLLAENARLKEDHAAMKIEWQEAHAELKKLREK